MRYGKTITLPRRLLLAPRPVSKDLVCSDSVMTGRELASSDVESGCPGLATTGELRRP